MSPDNQGNKSPTIAIAIITTLGVLGGALFANWDKVFPRSQPISTPPAPATPTPAPIQTETPTQASSPTTNTLKEKLLGIWYSEEVCPENGYTMASRGTSRYFNNGSFNTVGELAFLYKNEGGTLQVTYNIQFTGDWTLEGNQFISKIIDVKSRLASIKKDEVAIDLQQIDPAKLSAFPNLEQVIPRGMSSESTILNIGSNTMQARSDTGSCKGVTEFERRNEEFQLN